MNFLRLTKPCSSIVGDVLLIMFELLLLPIRSSSGEYLMLLICDVILFIFKWLGFAKIDQAMFKCCWRCTIAYVWYKECIDCKRLIVLGCWGQYSLNYVDDIIFGGNMNKMFQEFATEMQNWIWDVYAWWIFILSFQKPSISRKCWRSSEWNIVHHLAH